MTSPDDDGFASEEELEEIADAFVFAFGLAGPLDWVAELNQRLIAPAGRLTNARAAYDNPTRDSTDEIDAEAKAKIRIAATDYLSELLRMLHAMPLFQEQPQILEPLKFVITEFASVEKGRTLHWLQADPSKGIAINVLCFQVFDNGEQQLLSRTWLVDPVQTQVSASTPTSRGPREREPWNGQFCKPTTPKWRTTVDRLRERWKLND